MFDVRIPLSVFRKASMTGVRCVRTGDMLILYVRLFRDVVGPNLILMDYNGHDTSHENDKFL